MCAVTELAGTLSTTHPEPPGRPPVVRTVFYVLFAGWMGTILGLFALAAPTLLGVAMFPVNGQSAAWFDPETAGALLADVAAIGVFVWACGLTVRFCLGWVWSREAPAWTWTALTLAPAAVVAAGTEVTTSVVGVLAAVALRFTAYRADGSVRPEPLRPPSRIWALAAWMGLPVLAIGIATAYAMYHPLEVRFGGGGPLKPGRTAISLHGPTIVNHGGRPVRILAIEPGVERGYALHVTGVELRRMDVIRPGKPWTRPFRPFTIAPHGEHSTLALIISRAGCRPGASGRIDSVRVRYVLGGERTALLKLGEPLTLAC
jgi:hypothetical protein